MMDKIIVGLILVDLLFGALFVCGILADYVAPHIRMLIRWIDSLPMNWDWKNK